MTKDHNCSQIANVDLGEWRGRISGEECGGEGSIAGFEQGESREIDPMLPTATIYADALLTQRQPLRQLWSDSNNGSNRTELFNQKFIADDAASQLANHLLATLPAVGK